jgi:hypothetical protein
MPGLSLWQHPRFFGYFPANAMPAGILADLVSSRLGVLGLSLAIELGGEEQSLILAAQIVSSKRVRFCTPVVDKMRNQEIGGRWPSRPATRSRRRCRRR